VGHPVFRGILFTCCIKVLLYSSNLSKIGLIFSRDEIHEKNSRIHFHRLQNKCTNCKGVKEIMLDKNIKQSLPAPRRAIGGSVGIAPPILNFRTRCRWVVNFTLRLLYSPVKDIVARNEPEAGYVLRRKTSFDLTGNRRPKRPDRSQYSYNKKVIRI